MRIRDWSSDVCSSDLHIFSGASQAIIERSHNLVPAHHPDDLSRPEAIRPHTRAAMVDTDRHAVHAQGIYTANDKVGAGRCPAQQVPFPLIRFRVNGLAPVSPLPPAPLDILYEADLAQGL